VKNIKISYCYETRYGISHNYNKLFLFENRSWIENQKQLHKQKKLNVCKVPTRRLPTGIETIGRVVCFILL